MWKIVTAFIERLHIFLYVEECYKCYILFLPLQNNTAWHLDTRAWLTDGCWLTWGLHYTEQVYQERNQAPTEIKFRDVWRSIYFTNWIYSFQMKSLWKRLLFLFFIFNPRAWSHWEWFMYMSKNNVTLYIGENIFYTFNLNVNAVMNEK